MCNPFTNKNIERFLPYSAGLVVAIILFFCKGKILPYIQNVANDIYSLSMAFSSIVAAFLATAFGLMFAMKESNSMGVFRKTPHFGLVKEYMFMAILVNLVMSVLAYIGVAMPGLLNEVHVVIYILLSSCFIISVLQIIVLVRIFKNLI